MPEDPAIRSFVCLEIPAVVRDRIEQLQQRLVDTRADVSWVKKSSLHLTLKFLGGISPAQLESVRRTVKEAAAAKPSFTLQLTGTGCFPDERRPRVLWIGLAEVPVSLKDLYRSIDLGLSQIGFSSDARPFKPHLTFGRVKSSRNTPSLVQALKTAGFYAEAFSAGEVILMKSELKRSGAVYSPIQVFPLNG